MTFMNDVRPVDHRETMLKNFSAIFALLKGKTWAISKNLLLHNYHVLSLLIASSHDCSVSYTPYWMKAIICTHHNSVDIIFIHKMLVLWTGTTSMALLGQTLHHTWNGRALISSKDISHNIRCYTYKTQKPPVLKTFSYLLCIKLTR